jgi:hypothetical protein
MLIGRCHEGTGQYYYYCILLCISMYILLFGFCYYYILYNYEYHSMQLFMKTIVIIYEINWNSYHAIYLSYIVFSPSGCEAHANNWKEENKENKEKIHMKCFEIIDWYIIYLRSIDVKCEEQQTNKQTHKQTHKHPIGDTSACCIM